MPYFKYDGSLAAESAAPITNQYGSSAVETLTGTGSADSLWGSSNDHLVGAGGDDTFYLQGTGIQVVDTGGGVDTVVAWNNFDLANTPYVRNLQVGGSNDFAAGNRLDNLIVATGSNQNVYGGGGQDVLVGGSGPDTFIVVKGEGNDAIYGFKPGQDVIRLSAGYTSFAQVQQHLSQAGSDVNLDLGGGDGLVIRNTTVGALTSANFQLQIDASKVGAMTFGDEFSKPLSIWNGQYNPTGIWRPDYGYQGPQGAGSYTEISNGEQQIYTSPYFRGAAGDFASPFVSNPDGTLSIIAQPSANSQIFGYHYTSGMISTAQSFAQTYGYFEMRAELPTTAGAWPAFWLLPADGSWPPELDVMETLSNTPEADYTTAHSSATGSHTMSQGVAFIPPTESGFHTYGVLWSKATITWYVDGTQVYQAATPADMNKPMFMIANLALGGWGGAIDDAHLPAEMKIDFIHAYALADGSSVTTRDTLDPSMLSNATVSTYTPPPASTPAASSGGAVSNGGGGVVSGGGGAVSNAPETLVGRAGGDSLVGAAGNDTLTGSSGHNYLRGGAGADSISGGSGFNDINGNQGDDVIVGHSTVGDWLVGGQGNDQIHAVSSAHNLLYGNMGADSLVAGSGGDTLRGGQGDDSILGGAGADWISGDRGHDTVTGGGGADTFHTGPGLGVSTVTDFHVAEGDRVLLDVGSHPTVNQSGANVLIDLGGGTQMILQNTQLTSLGAGWLVYG